MDLRTQLEQAVRHAVSSLLETMIPIDFQQTDLAQAATVTGQHLLGMIQVNGRFNGSIAVSVPTDLAMAMTAAMLEEEIDELNDDVYETVAEMINMIAGGIKSHLSQQEEIFLLGLPQVLELSGSGGVVQDANRIAVPIDTEKGRLMVLSTLYESPGRDESAS